MDYLNAPLVRVKRGTPCPICGKPDWCSVSEDGAMAICMRVADGSVKESKGGGYIHILQDRELRPVSPIRRKPDPPPAASLDRRHVVYEALLQTLPLLEKHADDLARRGLSDMTFARSAYASLPVVLKTVYEMAETLSLFDNLANVPGFFVDCAGRWRFTQVPGFLIPVRDNQGRIQAFQIRRDRGEPRCIWFSTPPPDFKNGASSGAPIHFALPARAEESGLAIVTEGPLKADVVAEQLDYCVVGLPGVFSFPVNFGSWLTFKLPELKKVYVAYDTDWKNPKKPQVRAALLQLLDSLAETELECAVLDWEGAKGLDDLLVKEVAR